tara:strand:- start:66 stop:308 length:243 start_codon:yes stop_codon:yes gene_type:complete
MSSLTKDNSINITVNKDESIDMQTIRKMAFIYNAVNDGWTVVKKIDNYVFTKKHEGRKEVYSDDYLRTFIERNMQSVVAI